MQISKYKSVGYYSRDWRD